MTNSDTLAGLVCNSVVLLLVKESFWGTNATWYGVIGDIGCDSESYIWRGIDESCCCLLKLSNYT